MWWYSSSQLAGLPGLPNTERGVRKRAFAENWPSRPRRSKGGGCEYPIDCLPPEAQRVLKSRPQTEDNPPTNQKLCDQPPKAHRAQAEMPEEALPIVDIPPISTTTIVDAPGLEVPKKHDDRAQKRIDAKLEILKVLEGFCKTEGLKKVDCQCLFASKYNLKEIPLDDWVYEAVPKLCRATLCNFEKTLRTEGVTALGGKFGNREGRTKIDDQPAIRELAIAMLVDYPHISPARILEFLRGRFEEEILPSLRTVQRWVNCWKEENKEIFTAIKNPDGWKSKYMSAFGSYSENIKFPNQLWEMDSTPADILLADGRYSILGVVDVYTRRAALMVFKTSKATAIAALLRYCLINWGVPDKIKTDRGADYTSKHIKRVLAALDIEHQECKPFCPWQKPHIERFFRIFLHDLLELLPGFIGHNVGDRRELEAAKSFADRLMKRGEVAEIRMLASEFQKFSHRWLETYLHREHEGLDGKTPFQMLTASRAAIKRISSERALDILLAEAPGSNGVRVIQKRGVQVEGAWFIAPEMEAYMGQAVQVRFDPIDMGKIYLFDADGEFACIAECPERTGISRQEVAAKAREMQKRRVQEGRRALKQIAKKANTGEVVEEILSQREAVADRLVQFPAPAEEYGSDGLRIAEEVLRALDQTEQVKSSFSEEELAGVVLDVPHNDIVRDDDYFCDLWSRLKAGKKVPPVELDWMRHFLRTPEGRGCLRFLEIQESDVLPYLMTEEKERMAM